MGRPKATSSSATSNANRMVSQNACASIFPDLKWLRLASDFTPSQGSRVIVRKLGSTFGKSSTSGANCTSLAVGLRIGEQPQDSATSRNLREAAKTSLVDCRSSGRGHRSACGFPVQKQRQAAILLIEGRPR